MLNKCHDIANRAVSRHMTKTEFLEEFEKSGGNYYCFTPDELVALVKLVAQDLIKITDEVSASWTTKLAFHEVKREIRKQFELL